MKFATKELMTLTLVLVGLFLVLTHATGFSRNVSALGTAYVGGVKALQGRG